jgi:hypothetical protein
MPSPFPGMDPYLETPHLWPDVHHGLISQIQASLNPAVRPRYVVRVELRVYVSDDDDPGREVLVPDARVEKAMRKAPTKPTEAAGLAIAEPLIIPLLLDEEMKEARLEIKHLETGALVTVIEVLSPSNKVRGARGRESFMAKRRETLASDVHWVEIDLLRGGVPSVARRALKRSDYRILVSRADQRAQARYWPIDLRQPLPVIGIPLRAPDADVPLDMGAILRAAYDHGAYDLSIDYRHAPEPPLRAKDTSWAKRLLRESGLR